MLKPLDLKRWFPFLGWSRPTPATLAADARAGIAVGMVLVPQAVAYAVLAGMPPITGLYAALLPAVIGVFWGSCQLIGTGPTAMSAMLVAGSLTGLATMGSAEWVHLAIWLALLSGIIQILLGAFRLGSVVDFLSVPVVGAFTQGAAVLILATQLPNLFGLDSAAFARALEAVDPAAALSAVHWLSVALGVGTLTFLLALKRFSKRWPLVLIAGIISTVIAWAIGFSTAGGRIVGDLPSGLPNFGLPMVPAWNDLRQLLPMAVVIALVSFIEAVGSARAISRERGERWHSNQELIGQGLAKMSSGLSGAFPVGASFSRSALYLYAGAASGWSAVVTALCVVASLLWLTPALAWVPMPFLAAVIIASVLNLIRPHWFVELWKSSRSEAAIALGTLLATLIAAPQLQWGVLTGFILSVVHFLYKRATSRLIEVSAHPDGTLRDRQRFNLPRLAPDVLAVRMDASLNFVTATRLDNYIREACERDPEIRRVLLHCGPINEVDTTGVDTLRNLLADLQKQGIAFCLTSMKKQVEDRLDRAGLLLGIAPECIFRTEAEAISALQSE